jgi:hypothetical protein
MVFGYMVPDAHTVKLLTTKKAVGTGGASIEGVKLNATVIYFLKGAVFVSFSDLVLGKAAPSESDMESEANTVLGRI